MVMRAHGQTGLYHHIRASVHLAEPVSSGKRLCVDPRCPCDSLTRPPFSVTPGSLDEKGREIDEEGNLVKVDLSDLRTVKANIAGKDDKKKKEPENPYLAYSRPDEVRGDTGPIGGSIRP